MDPRYEAYFARRLASYRRERFAAYAPFGEDVQRVVREGLQAAEMPPPISVRPDAVAFLVINLHEMVVLPTMAIAREETPSLVRDALPRDVANIVQAAAQQAQAGGDSEVSSHDILKAVAARWSDLQFAAPWRWEGQTG
jgi:hypothetical protein